MTLQPHDTDTHLLESREVAPVTGEHRVRPGVTLDLEPPSGVPVWEPDAGDYS